MIIAHFHDLLTTSSQLKKVKRTDIRFFGVVNKHLVEAHFILLSLISHQEYCITFLAIEDKKDVLKL